MSNRQRECRVLDKPGMGIVDGVALQASGDDLAALRADIQRLMDIEAIKQLKYAYFRCIDTANIAELAGLFHEQVYVHFIGGSYEWVLNNRQEYLQAIGQSFHHRSVGHHNGHHPEIQWLSEHEATGIWYLADHMWNFEHKAYTRGTALYWDRYQKIDGRWLIRETRYERLYEINERQEQPPKFSVHYLAERGNATQGAN